MAVLAPAIGAATAVFRVTDATLLRPGAFHDPERLAILWESDPRNPMIEVSYPDYSDVAAGTSAFAGAAAHGSTTWSVRLTDAGDPVDLPLGAVSGGLFRVLGATPLLGRTLLPDDDAPDALRVAVIAHALWRQRFGADPSVLGRTVRLDGHPTSIVGVMPPRFDYPAGAQVWSPLPRVLGDSLSPEAKQILRRIGFLYVVARLGPGVSRQQARAEADAALQTTHTQNGGPADRRVVLTPLTHHLLGPVRPALLLMVIAVSLVLLLACANAAGLVLVRAASREREIAVRRALGASRAGVLRLLTVDSAILCAVACVAGLAIAWLSLQALQRLAPPALAKPGDLALDAASIAAAVLAASVAAIVSGVWSWRRTGGPPMPLSGGSRMTADHTGRGRRLLIGAEVALALIVVTAAALASRSFVELASVDLGYDADRVLLVDLPVDDDLRNLPDAGRGHIERLGAALAAIPGVQAAGGVSLKPLALGPIGDDAGFQLDGQTLPDARANPFLNFLRVTPGYFDAMGIRIVAGRAFTGRDMDAAEPVAIVSEVTARRLWGETGVLGRKIRVFGHFPGDPIATVVGVSEAVRHRELHHPRLDFYAAGWRTGTWVLRTAAEPETVAGSVRAAVRSIDAAQPVEITPLLRLVSSARRPWEFTAVVLASFALLSILLAATGVHALIAYAVSRRTQEFGVRAALGAQPSDIAKLVLRGAGIVALAGLAAGIPGALAAGYAMRSLLFGVSALDPVSIAGAALIIASSVAAACLIPARRAAAIDPIIAMRCE